jgi:ferritin
MLSKKIETALNGQVNNEVYSAYLYMAMSSHATNTGLKGFANWFMVQYHEEMLHAMKLFEYIQKKGGVALVGTIKQPPASWASPLDMFEQTYTHEQFITKCINDLSDLAVAEKDHATQVFLQWYVNEQVEEEQNDTDIIAQLKMIGDSKPALVMLDKDLSARMVTVPTDYSKGVEAAMRAKAGGAAA